MEEQFQLKQCGYNLFEQHIMPAEERAWQIERMNKEIKRRNNQSSGAAPGTQTRAMPPAKKS